MKTTTIDVISDYKMIDEASKKPIAYDEDCPELTDSEIINEMIKIYNRKSANSSRIAN